jgi:hypothetical protein
MKPKHNTLVEQMFSELMPNVKFVPFNKPKNTMQNVIAVYIGSRVVWNTINLKGREQKVMVTLHEWNNVTDEHGELIAKIIETKEAKSYENLIQWKKYRITASEITTEKIIRPSKCERIPEIINNIPVIQDIVTRYKSDMITEEGLWKAMEQFSQDDILKYIIAVINKSKTKQS